MEEIEHGDKTIKLSIKLWTSNIPTNNRKVAWNRGVVHIMANRSRGIRPKVNPIPFNSFEELTNSVIKLLKEEGITILKPGKDKKAEVLF